MSRDGYGRGQDWRECGRGAIALWYNAGEMITKRARMGIRGLLAIVGVVALLAPLAGSALDHHFAERQPDHLHIGAAHTHSHLHAFERAAHVHHAVGGKRPAGADMPIALYKNDGSVAAAQAQAAASADAGERALRGPTSAFILPVVNERRLLPHSPHPPDKPPNIPL